MAFVADTDSLIWKSEQPSLMLRWWAPTANQAAVPILQQKWLIHDSATKSVSEEWRNIPFAVGDEK